MLIHLEGQPRAAAVSLRILSGYNAAHCGLDGFEVYGEGGAFTSDGQACSISAEVAGLAPGARVHYRVVLEDGDEIVAGDVLSLAVPGSLVPTLESALPLRRSRDPFCYAVRGNAMGLETELWAELALPDGTVCIGPRISLGAQPTGRHIYYQPAGIPAVAGQFRLRARNAVGEAELIVPWPAP